MKKLISFAMIVCIAVLYSCEDGKNTYTVTGTVPDPDLNGQTVYMSDYNIGQIVDSTTVTGGKFVFKGVADSAMAINLIIGNLSAEMILEKGKLTVDMGEAYSARGNALTKKLNEYFLKSHAILSDAQEKYMQAENSEDAETVREDILNGYTTKMNDLAAEYLKNHSNDMLGALIFINKWQTQATAPDETSFREAIEGLGENILNFGPIKQMAEVYENLNRTAEGQMFTDFTIENGNLDNTSARFSDYIGKGKYILVDFWASWCGPCLKEIPNLKAIYEKYKGDKFDILGVAVWDRREDTLNSIEKEGVKWNQIIDAQTIPTELYGIQGIPHIILFAPDGSIVKRNLRGNAIGEKIAEVLKTAN
jgi:thiol-disulfide isomerase/thioredoxin